MASNKHGTKTRVQCSTLQQQSQGIFEGKRVKITFQTRPLNNVPRLQETRYHRDFKWKGVQCSQNHWRGWKDSAVGWVSRNDSWHYTADPIYRKTASSSTDRRWRGGPGNGCVSEHSPCGTLETISMPL